MENKNTDFWAKCAVCGTIYINWSGSTACCGSIAHLVDEDGHKTDSITIYAKLDNPESNQAPTDAGAVDPDKA